MSRESAGPGAGAIAPRHGGRGSRRVSTADEELFAYYPECSEPVPEEGEQAHPAVQHGGTKDNSFLGWVVSAGDYNNDGIDDIAIAQTDNNGATAAWVYVIFGHSGAWTTPTDPNAKMNGTNGVLLDWVGTGYWAGMDLVTADYNGDGIKDLFIGTPNDNATSTDVGFIAWGHGGACQLQALARPRVLTAGGGSSHRRGRAPQRYVSRPERRVGAGGRERLANRPERVYGRPVTHHAGAASMHVPPNPTQVLSHAERLAREQHGSRMGLVFQGITSICLGVMTAKMVLDTVREARDPDRDRGTRADGPAPAHAARANPSVKAAMPSSAGGRFAMR